MAGTRASCLVYTEAHRLRPIDIRKDVGQAATVMVRTRSSGERAHAQEHAP